MKLAILSVGVLVSAWLGQFALAYVTPSMIMELLYYRGGDRDYNTMVIAPRPDETVRQVVRPSPDLLYARCIYDLKQGLLEIDARVPEGYWSMQFYQMNTDNFAGLTNQREESHRVGSIANVTLIGPGQKQPDGAGEVLVSPTQRGIVILRVSAIGDDSAARAALRESRCAIAY